MHKLKRSRWLSRHPDFRLQPSWIFLQGGVMVVPLFPILGALLFFLALVGTWRRTFWQIIYHPSSYALAATTIAFSLSTIFAKNPLESLLGLSNFLPYFLMFAAYRMLVQTLPQLYQLAWLITLPSFIVSILGLGQLFGHWKTPAIMPMVFGWELIPGGNPLGRMSSVFMYTNLLAVYLLIAFTFSLGLLTLEIQKRKRSRSKESSDILKFYFLMIVTPLNFLSIILTYSRSAWGILALILLSYALYVGWRWLVGIVAILTSLVLAAAYAPSPFQEPLRRIVPMYFWARLTDQLYLDRPIPLMRITQWKFTLWMMQERPVFGWGLRNFTPLYQEKMQIFLGHPHQLFLMLGAETGLIGFLLFVGFVGWFYQHACLYCFRSLSPQSPEQLLLFTYLVAFGSLIVFNLGDVTVFDLRMNGLGWLLLAALAGVTSQPSK